MRLYQSLGPNPRVTTMYLSEKGIAIDRVFVDIVEGENRQPAYLSKNPAGGVPCLERDDGSYLPDGVAICEYLEELYPYPPLLGATPEQRADTRAAIRMIDQSVTVPMTNGFRSAEGLAMFADRMLCAPEAADGNKAYARDGLEKLDAKLAGQGWVCGDRFTLADIVLFAFVEFGAQVGQPIPEGSLNLAAWHQRVAARPSAGISANPQNGI